jgi:ArsR family transcriptional regulator, arsenate/arsenite/antimonite-responsive transcriptional repressor
VSTKELGVVEENSASKGGAEEGVERLVALGRALSDPIRVRMLSMMAEGRSCCDFSDSGVPAGEGEEGICVCEFEEVFSMGQSKVSYHMKKLKDAGLVREERRGKWAFYSLDREAAGALLGEAADRLLSSPEKRRVVGGCC